MNKASHKPEAVGDILGRVLKDLELDKRIEEGKALEQWAAAAGEKLARKTRAVSVVRGRMTVECQGSSWAQECRMLKPRLLEKLNKSLGCEVVKDIVFRTGDF